MDNNEEEVLLLLFNQKVTFPNFEGSNLMNEVKIPFQLQVPQKAYPTCIFSQSDFVRHYLTVEFPSIEAKRTVIIVIKNTSYFYKENKLLLSPAIHFREIKKKNFFAEKGSYTASLKLPTNIFSYDQKIPFEIDIDVTNLIFEIN